MERGKRKGGCRRRQRPDPLDLLFTQPASDCRRPTDEGIYGRRRWPQHEDLERPEQSLELQGRVAASKQLDLLGQFLEHLLGDGKTQYGMAAKDVV
eukprot:753925-Hanusia_phi.AAC.2